MSEPVVEVVPSTIDPSPEPRENPGLQLPSSFPFDLDVPGPSNTFIPPSSSRTPPPAGPSTAAFENGDDEIAHSLPIYLSPTLFPHLHLYQYPLHHRPISAPSWATDRGKDITTRVKEAVGRVELEIPVDAGGNVWRDDRARELGFVPDVLTNGDAEVEGGFGFGGRGPEGTAKKKRRKREEKWGENVRLRSEVVPNATGYYAGIIHEGGSHRRLESRV